MRGGSHVHPHLPAVLLLDALQAGLASHLVATQIPEEQEKRISTPKVPAKIMNAAKNILQLAEFLPHQKQEQ